MRCWNDVGLWNRIGPLSGRLDQVDDADLALYARLANMAGVMLETCGFRERSWTRFRIASAAILEARSGQVWSTNRRRRECGCQSVDFRRRLAGVYEAVLMAARFRLGNSPLQREARR